MLNNFSTFIFDLDRTLYPYSSNVLPQVDEKIALYCQKICQVDLETAHNIRKQYYYTYGATLTGLIKEYHIDADDFLDYVHSDIDYTDLQPCSELIEVLMNLKGQKIIYTNGTKHHAMNVLKQRNLINIFDDIHDIRASNLHPKPSADAFHAFINKYKITPNNAVFFDDSLFNTQTAKELGIYSVQVLEQEIPNIHHHCERRCDETIYSLAEYLRRY